jgi:hypothetical protein
MKPLAYLLLLLLLSAQADDAWVVALGLPSDSPAAENDEYLPAEPRAKVELSSSHREPLFVGLKRRAAVISTARRRAPSQRNLTPPFAPPPLYALMSLQI